MYKIKVVKHGAFGFTSEYESPVVPNRGDNVQVDNHYAAKIVNVRYVIESGQDDHIVIHLEPHL